MWLALAGALIPVALGVALGLAPGLGSDQLRPVRLVALGAALVVVLVMLLPAAWRGIGWLSLLAFGAALLAPVLVEKAYWRLGSAGVGRELGYLALLVHQAADGLEVGGAAALGTGLGAMILAVAVHSVPLVTVVTLDFAQESSRSAAVWRGLGLLLATGAGVVGASWSVGVLPEAAHPWIQAVLAGILLHILWHDFAEDPHGAGSHSHHADGHSHHADGH